MERKKTTELGRAGEDRAAAYLESRGYTILHRNYYYRRAEIDLIARKGPWLVIVEVKTRTGSFYEALSDSVSRLKISRLVRAAHHFAGERGLGLEIRFDVIQVLHREQGYECIHHPDAFYFF